VRRAQLRGRGPSSNTRLRVRRCSQSERHEAAEDSRYQDAACDAPRSRRLRATCPAQRPSAVKQRAAAREELLTERAA